LTSRRASLRTHQGIALSAEGATQTHVWPGGPLTMIWGRITHPEKASSMPPLPRTIAAIPGHSACRESRPESAESASEKAGRAPGVAGSSSRSCPDRGGGDEAVGVGSQGPARTHRRATQARRARKNASNRAPPRRWTARWTVRWTVLSANERFLAVRSGRQPNHQIRSIPSKQGKSLQISRCRRRDSNPRHADYDSAALTD
jgi:hypothetical protein